MCMSAYSFSQCYTCDNLSTFFASMGKKGNGKQSIRRTAKPSRCKMVSHLRTRITESPNEQHFIGLLLHFVNLEKRPDHHQIGGRTILVENNQSFGKWKYLVKIFRYFFQGSSALKKCIFHGQFPL